MQFLLTTIMVIDKHKNGVPVAWILHERNTAEALKAWLQPLVEEVRKLAPNWMPSCAFVDDCDSEIKAIK